ncbi:MFS transporter [Agromyces mangrovi Wang et al. 2018]|uniref:MFS transporter n=1 Tax=Agromyces mangrovi TaxID=1858653 RepID=UPI002573124A|nr:MFS transporter [Agromyces mangrovi]BDZ66386.1 hypothetical protein GCM10025877_33240 [Agromyces mangrovi]
MSSVPPAPLYTRAFIALTATELLYFTAVGMALFALPLFVTGPLGGDEAGAGIAIGAFAASALVLRPFAGRLSDRIGRRPLMLGGALLAASALGLLLVADDLVVVVLLRLLAGVAEAAFFVSSFAALADIAPPERMGEALSINSLGLYLGLAFGPPLAEALIGVGDFAAVWIGATGLTLVAAALALVVGETSTERTPRMHRCGSSIVLRCRSRSPSSRCSSPWAATSRSRRSTPCRSASATPASRC